MSDRPIYLDHHSTTPVDPRVLDAMLPYFAERFGNPGSSSHRYGWEADGAVGDARLAIVELVGARSPDEIVFTSGATESNNLAILGAMRAAGSGHLITSAIEHPSVTEAARQLTREGFEWTEVCVGTDGVVSVSAIEAAIRPDTRLISVMAVNNEVGTIQPTEAIAELARERGIRFHCDAAQAAGRVALSTHRDGVDLLSVSAHKIYGPKGVGALYVRRSPEVTPLAVQMFGGGQERGLRSGTANVPALVGFGAAARLAHDERAAEHRRLAGLRDRLLERLALAVPELRVHGSLEKRVGGNLNLSFPGLRADALLNALPGLALSGGAACSSGKPGGSRVLRAMGVDDDAIHGAIRIGLGRTTRETDVTLAAAAIAQAARRHLRRAG